MRSLMLYVALVGGPLLVLLAIFQAGDGLVPPRSVGGSWDLAAPIVGPIAACAGAGPSGAADVRIIQSGVWLVVRLGADDGLQLAAELDGAQLTGRAATRAAPGCPGGRLELRAILDADAARISGTLALADCAACGEVPFQARRRPEPR